MPGPRRGPTDDSLTNAAISAAMSEERLYGDSPASGYRDGNVLYVESDGILRWSDPSLGAYDPPYDYSASWDSWRGAIADLRAPWEERPAAGDFYDATQALRHAAELLRPGTSTDGEGTDTQIQGAGKLPAAINTLMGDLAGMDGNTIYTFRANYADRLENINQGQFALAYVLGQCVTAEAEIWNQANIDYQELISQGTAAFWAVRDYQTFGGGGGDFSTELKVAGAVLSAVGIFATGGLSTVVGIGSLGVGLLEDFAPDGGAPEPKITGTTAQAVLTSLSNALGDLRDEIRKQEDAVAQCLQENLGVLTKSPHQFDLKSPALLDEDTPEQIGFKVDQGRMRRCGNRTCPRVASAFGEAADAVRSASGSGPWTRPAYFGAPTGPYPSFGDLLAELEYAAENTSYEITTAGRLLALSADYFDDADGNAQEALAKLHKLVRDHDDHYPEKPDYTPPPVDGWAMAMGHGRP